MDFLLSDLHLSAAEKRLLKTLPSDGAPLPAQQCGFATAGEALRAAGAPERHGLVTVMEESSVSYALTPEGVRVQENGLPERRAVAAIGEGLPMGDLAIAAGLDAGEVKVAIGWLKRKGWADIQKGTLILKAGEPAEGEDERLLAALSTEPGASEADLSELVKRGLVDAHASTTRSIALTKAGQKVAKDLPDDLGEDVNQVTPAFIARYAEMDAAARANVDLRPFDFDVDVAARHPGKPHPLTQLMTQIRQVFLGMGFQEISGDYVESAFWNMDALFIPQDHPAREMQDTFYLATPATLDVDEADLERGQAVHEHGADTGSTGWGGTFSKDVSKKALLRTHTTNTTVRYLAEHPTGVHKVFGLGRVFRNETMDATHLPEFHQIEGIVTEPGANFNMLVGLCRVFFAAMGFPEVRFRPAYFPYTEPSMEIDVKYHGKWMELGGCGVFRPEVTEPLGVTEPVLAWGFGLERLAMMRLGIKDIRQLYISDIQWLKEQPLL